MTTQRDEPDNPHFVKVEPGGIVTPSWQYDATVTFQCRGDRTSKCHQYPDCDCEGWDCNHMHASHDECWMQGWFASDSHVYSGPDAYDMSDTCVPPDMNRSGPIVASYDLDGFVDWEFAK